MLDRDGSARARREVARAETTHRTGSSTTSAPSSRMSASRSRSARSTPALAGCSTIQSQQPSASPTYTARSVGPGRFHSGSGCPPTYTFACGGVPSNVVTRVRPGQRGVRGAEPDRRLLGDQQQVGRAADRVRTGAGDHGRASCRAPPHRRDRRRSPATRSAAATAATPGRGRAPRRTRECLGRHLERVQRLDRAVLRTGPRQRPQVRLASREPAPRTPAQTFHVHDRPARFAPRQGRRAKRGEPGRWDVRRQRAGRHDLHRVRHSLARTGRHRAPDERVQVRCEVAVRVLPGQPFVRRSTRVPIRPAPRTRRTTGTFRRARHAELDARSAAGRARATSAPVSRSTTASWSALWLIVPVGVLRSRARTSRPATTSARSGRTAPTATRPAGRRATTDVHCAVVVEPDEHCWSACRGDHGRVVLWHRHEGAAFGCPSRAKDLPSRVVELEDRIAPVEAPHERHLGQRQRALVGTCAEVDRPDLLGDSASALTSVQVQARRVGPNRRRRSR